MIFVCFVTHIEVLEIFPAGYSPMSCSPCSKLLIHYQVTRRDLYASIHEVRQRMVAPSGGRRVPEPKHLVRGEVVAE